jgi:hypothetical protein
MIFILSRKIYVLIVHVCRNESNERSSWPVNEDRHKGDADSQIPVSFVHKGEKIIVAQILYMQDRRPHAMETPGLANIPCRRAPASRQWRVLLDFNYWAPSLVTVIKWSSVMDTKAGYWYGSDQ